LAGEPCLAREVLTSGVGNLLFLAAVKALAGVSPTLRADYIGAPRESG
jgi:hypothetical protein